MIRYRAAAGILAVSLTGCGVVQQREYNALIAQCQVIPRAVGHYAEWAECYNTVATQMGWTDPSNSLINAKRSELAAWLDQGQITPAQAQMEFSALVYQVQQQDRAMRFREVAASNAAAATWARITGP